MQPKDKIRKLENIVAFYNDLIRGSSNDVLTSWFEFDNQYLNIEKCRKPIGGIFQYEYNFLAAQLNNCLESNCFHFLGYLDVVFLKLFHHVRGIDQTPNNCPSKTGIQSASITVETAIYICSFVCANNRFFKNILSFKYFDVWNRRNQFNRAIQCPISIALAAIPGFYLLFIVFSPPTQMYIGF